MRLPLTVIMACIAHFSVSALGPARRYYTTHNYYVLEHDPRSGGSLQDVTKALGVEVVEQAGELVGHWIVRAEKRISGHTIRDAPPDPVLRSLELLQSVATSPRSFSKRSEEYLHAKRVTSSIKYLSRQTLRRRTKRAPPPIPESTNTNSTSHTVASRLGIVDPLFDKQWHLINDEFPQHMMNVSALWDMGITGKGVITALVDDGLDYRSADLAANFYAPGSYDFNDHVDLPTPKLVDDHHGTRCAGQIAAVKNDVCGIGIAYESKVAGIRILSGPITDVDESSALNYGFQNTSIYSCSWGPPDDGKSMEGPDYLIRKSVVNGIYNGRRGKGSIFVFASGNGAAHGDQCNFDGYTNSIYSVTVAAVDYRGLHPYYSESCAANMIVAYSSGSGNHIYTTDIGENKCSTTHGGTSAAAPNAVGVFALALEIRPDLSWRDIQHLCVQTAQIINPEDPDWETMATGRLFSYKYGFGVLNGLEYVTAARDWKLVKPQTWVDTPVVQINNGTMNITENMNGGEPIRSGGIFSTILVTKEMLESDNFETLEHVTIQVWISHTKRGDVEVELISPGKIRSVLAAPRAQDTDTSGFPGWTFMSVKHWGENPLGVWTIRVSDQNAEGHSGAFLGWRMTFWGSTVDPTKTKTYTVPIIDTLLPPLDPTHEHPPSSASTLKTYPKPTANLPGDHGTAEGEKHKPAFSSGIASQPTGLTTPTPDEGWFPDMSNLLSGRKWVFGALGIVGAFGIAAAVFFWRRRMARWRRGYSSLGTEDGLAMGIVDRDGRVRTGGVPTKELYDAFGEISDDDDYEDADEPGLRHHRLVDAHGFRASFADDNGVPSIDIYRDEPEDNSPLSEPVAAERDDSNRSATSGDGSWEHASPTR